MYLLLCLDDNIVFDLSVDWMVENNILFAFGRFLYRFLVQYYFIHFLWFHWAAFPHIFLLLFYFYFVTYVYHMSVDSMLHIYWFIRHSKTKSYYLILFVDAPGVQYWKIYTIIDSQIRKCLCAKATVVITL